MDTDGAHLITDGVMEEVIGDTLDTDGDTPDIGGLDGVIQDIGEQVTDTTTTLITTEEEDLLLTMEEEIMFLTEAITPEETIAQVETIPLAEITQPTEA